MKEYTLAGTLKIIHNYNNTDGDRKSTSAFCRRKQFKSRNTKGTCPVRKLIKRVCVFVVNMQYPTHVAQRGFALEFQPYSRKTLLYGTSAVKSEHYDLSCGEQLQGEAGHPPPPITSPLTATCRVSRVMDGRRLQFPIPTSLATVLQCYSASYYVSVSIWETCHM